jgi:hypothetical protein
MAKRLQLKCHFQELNLAQILAVTFPKHHTLLSVIQTRLDILNRTVYLFHVRYEL